MTRKTLFLSHACAAAGAVGVLLALGAGKPAQPEMPGDMKAAMDNWLKTISPGKPHKHLEQFVGEWETTMRMFMAPGQPPIETKGTARCEMILGGRYLKMDSAGSFKMPGPDGAMADMPHNGLGLTGYDNNRKLYTMMWADNMGTGLITGKGNLSQDGRTMTMFGEMDEPMTGEMGKPVRYVTRVIDADRYIFEISEVLYGEPFKVVEIEYVRKAGKQ